MRRAEILELIEKSGLAGSVKEYCAGVIRSGSGSSLKDALKADAAQAVENIGRLLAAGGDILGCSKEEVLFATGFNGNNRAPERFESALAELRTAEFLHHEGFVGLKLIGAGAKKSADLFGVKSGRGYVFEVCCLRRHDDPAAVPAAHLAAKRDDKLVQVSSSRKEYGCEGGGIVFVTDPFTSSAFAADPGLKKLARGLHAGKSGSRSVHICLLSADGAAVFPEWRGDA